MSEFSKKPHQICRILLNLNQFLQKVTFLLSVFQSYRKFFFFFPISTLIDIPHLKFYVLPLSLFLSLFPVFSECELLLLSLLNPIFIYLMFIKLSAKSLQSCPTLCDPMDCSSPGSSVHRILQARILEWVATSSSRGFSGPRD